MQRFTMNKYATVTLYMNSTSPNERPAPTDNPAVKKNAMIVPAVSACCTATRRGPYIMHSEPRYLRKRMSVLKNIRRKDGKSYRCGRLGEIMMWDLKKRVDVLMLELLL